MAGSLTISTLKDSSGVLATQNGMTGIAKAWVNFTGGQGNTAGTVVSAFNVSSITVNTTADYTINFTTAMPNANYVAVGSVYNELYSFPADGSWRGTLNYYGANLTTSYRCFTKYVNAGSSGAEAETNVLVAIFSS
jgi:hypothetical protein